VHPETEIAVIGIAEGAVYAGLKSAVGTSGGGFALMVEHLSLAGQAEIPIVIVLAQRPGPATGVPTYTEQGDLFFSIFAGHGEFPRIVIAPGDIEEAFYLSADAMNLAWKFQVPVIILSDKHLSESTFSFTGDEEKIRTEESVLWKGKGNYKRYLYTEDGISPLAFPGDPEAIVKVNSYEHDEYGVTTEEPEIVAKGHEKRLRKMETIRENLKSTETVKVYGNRNSRNCIITWGSTKGAVIEVAEDLGLKVVQPLYMHPLPHKKIKEELKGCNKVVSVEVNSTAQFTTWLSYHGIKVNERILKYDGRPFTFSELKAKVKEAIK
jgi:2-oxoglutarate ferredoxin oxidoreductase subunit alpha